MLESKSLQIQKLVKQLRKLIKNNILDIFIIGSFLKNKLEPGDLDIIVLFKNKDLKEIEELFFEIKEKINIDNVHIEPLFADSLFEEKIFLTVIHEGFSIKYKKEISKILDMNSYSIFSFNLINLSKIDKVKFAQALYGRKKDGLLYNEKGVSLGQGSFMVLVEREEIFKEFMEKWKIKYKVKRAFVSD